MNVINYYRDMGIPKKRKKANIFCNNNELNYLCQLKFKYSSHQRVFDLLRRGERLGSANL